MDRINRAKHATVKGYETTCRGSYASAVLAPLIIMMLFVAGCGGGSSSGTAPTLAALRVLAAGETYVPIEMLSIQEPAKRQTTSYLTGRERDVLNGLLAGQSNKEIARVHGLSEVTIKHHLKSLRSKLGARNRTHAVCRAVELGIAEDDYAMA